MSRKKHKGPRKLDRFLLWAFLAVLTIAILALLGVGSFVFLESSKIQDHEVYVSSLNAKQGGTLLVKVNGKYQSASGMFNNESFDFYQSGPRSNWTAFVGIDSALNPGKYKIYVKAGWDTLEKEITVESKDFSSVGAAMTKDLQNKGFTQQSVGENIVKSDNPALNQVLEKNTEGPYFTDSFSYPLRNVKISGLDFGKFVKSASYKLQHLGVDLRAEPGTKVYSVNYGKVVFVKDLKNYGKTIVIDHGLGIYSIYLHLSEYKVAEGQHVKKGEVIALSGNTGYSTAPHLHFSIRDNKARVDPLEFIKISQQADENLNLANISRAILKIFDISIN